MRLQTGRGRAQVGTAGLVVGAALMWSNGSATAQQAVATDQLVRERLAFDAADTDGDGVVSEAELARDAARGFATLDRNGSETLTPDELGPHAPAQFSRVDANGDGALTFKEVMTNKVRALNEGDKNQDGGLSFEEMTVIVGAETGGAS